MFCEGWRTLGKHFKYLKTYSIKDEKVYRDLNKQ